jgi:hypothetical protein
MVHKLPQKTLNITDYVILDRKRSRQLFNQVVREQTTAQFYPHIERATSRLLINLLQCPEAFEEHTTT